LSTPPPKPPPDDYTVDVACPHCGAVIGRPTSVSTRKGDPSSVDVKMACADCNHLWVVQKLTNDEPPA
jgi:ribosomal protein S27E